MRVDGGYSPEAWIGAVARWLWRSALWSGGAAGLIYAAGRLRLVLMYLFVGAILAYIMRPMAGWLARRNIGVPRSKPMHVRRAFATVYVLVLLFVGGFYSVRYMINPFITEIRNVSDNWDSEYKYRFEEYNKRATGWYTKTVKKEWRDWIAQQVRKNQDGGGVQAQVAGWFGEVSKRVGDVAHNVVEIVLLPVLAFYFALDSKKLKREFVGTLPRQYRRETLRIIHNFNQIMHSFVIGQAILCAIAGLVVGLGLALLGVKYPLTLGLLAGFTRAIPIIGPILGGIPIIVLVLVSKGFYPALLVLAFFTLLHFVESKFIMPMLIGERMNLHPVIIIIVLLIGQEFGGLLGMFFAAPVAALIRVIVRRYWLKTHLNADEARLERERIHIEAGLR